MIPIGKLPIFLSVFNNNLTIYLYNYHAKTLFKQYCKYFQIDK